MDVPQVCGQFRQMRFNVGTGLIPVQQRADGEVVPQIMDTRAAQVPWFAQTDLTGDQKEPAIDTVVNQAVSSVPDEEARSCPLRINTISD